MKLRSNLRAVAIFSSAVLIAVSGMAQAAGKSGHGGRHHHHGAPRVSIGVGVGFGGFYDPFFDPFYDPFFGNYPPYAAYGYVPQPPVPCTPADVPTKEPSTNIFSPDYAYDRIDASRCAPVAAAPVPVAPPVQAPPAVQPPPAYYFCRSTNAYYPNVKVCAEGWQQVAPKPPGT